MPRTFPRTINALDDIFDCLGSFIAEHGIDEEVAFAVKLAVEELVINLVKHNTGGRDFFEIDMQADTSQMVLKLLDFDVEPFDITKVKPPKLDQPLTDRDIGGLGLHLVKSVIDKLVYEYEDRVMCITLIKKLEPKNV